MTTIFARWVESVQFAAFGSLGLSLEQFEAMTPKEFNDRVRAVTEQEHRQFERLAQLACWVINPWLGENARPLHVSDLLRRAAPTGDES